MSRPDHPTTSNDFVEEEEEHEEEGDEESRVTRRLLISREEALQRLVERIGPMNIVPKWGLDDLKGLMVQIMRNRCDAIGVQHFVDLFQGTSVEEILDCIQSLRNLNHQAEEERLQVQTSHLSAPQNRLKVEKAQLEDKNNKNNLSTAKDWVEAITKIKRFRRLPDESTSILPDVIDGLVEDEPEDKYYQITTDPSSMSYGMLTALNYKEIYSQIIEKMLSARCLQRPRGIDAAIVLDIFDEMERDIEKFPQLIDFFRLYFSDLKTYSANEFKIDKILNEENIAKIVANPFPFSGELLNLSSLVNDTNNTSE